MREDADDLLIRRDGAVTILTINRPGSLNAIDPPLHEALQAAFDAFADDPGQRVCVVTGAGERAFSVGSDLKHIAARQASEGEARLTPLPRDGYAGLIERDDLAKPVIAAVNGLALGGGFEIALACDIIVAADRARFGLPEARVGAFAIGGGVHRLARQIPLKRAMAMALTGEQIDAAEALALGLVNEVVAASELAAATARWCEKLLACAPTSVALAKQAMMRGLDEPSLGAAIRAQRGYPAFRDWIEGDDLREGSRAFVEKRRPRWQEGER